MYYAELSGDWDGDNDGTYGEWDDYNTYSDPDLFPEVKVGRIPVYKNDYTNLDAILQKIMDYQNTKDSIAWRKSALLPMSFQARYYDTLAGYVNYDGAPLAEQLWDDYLDGYDFSRYRMYQQGNSSCTWNNSTYPSDEELRGNRVRDHWKDDEGHDYGVVCWWGHGSATSSSVGYEWEDTHGTIHNCWDGTLFSSSQCSDLDNSHPAVVFQNSCTNGHPETTTNLGYSLLLKGAIGTYSASRLSWHNTGVGYGNFDGSSTNSGIAYEVTRRVAGNQFLGDALSSGKQAVISDIGTRNTRLMNQYDFNLYGDPSLKINDQDSIAVCQTLNEALDNNSLSFVNEGDAHWFCHTKKVILPPPYSGILYLDDAQSGDITEGESSTFYTVVKGPGVLEFQWRVWSEQNWDYLRFYDNGVKKYEISGDVAWHKKTYDVPDGTHTLKWSYEKDSTCCFDGEDCGWVDLVTYSRGKAMPWLYLLLLDD